MNIIRDEDRQWFYQQIAVAVTEGGGFLHEPEEVGQAILDALALRIGFRLGQRLREDEHDLIVTLVLARKEIVHLLHGDERLISSSVTLFAIDKVLAQYGLQASEAAGDKGRQQ
jgi:hypothetical protein